MKRRGSWNVEPLEGRSLLSGVSATLTTNASDYQSGQPVLITYTETDNSASPVFVVEGPSVDAFVVQQNGQTVWRSNEGMVPMYLRTEMLQPGQSLTIHATWDGRENGDGAALSGTFVVSNLFQPTAPPAAFQIAAPTGAEPPSPPPAGPPPIFVAPLPGGPGRHHHHRHAHGPGRHLANVPVNVHGHQLAHDAAPHRFSGLVPGEGRHRHG